MTPQRSAHTTKTATTSWKPAAVTTFYSVPDDGRKGRPKHVKHLTPNKEH